MKKPNVLCGPYSMKKHRSTSTVSREKNGNTGITDCGICHELNDHTQKHYRLYLEMDIFRVAANNKNVRLARTMDQCSTYMGAFFAVVAGHSGHSPDLFCAFFDGIQFNSLLIRQTIGLSVCCSVKPLHQIMTFIKGQRFSFCFIVDVSAL